MFDPRSRHCVCFGLAAWSRGMIPASGAGGPGFESPCGPPFFWPFCFAHANWLNGYFNRSHNIPHVRSPNGQQSRREDTESAPGVRTWLEQTLPRMFIPARTRTGSICARSGLTLRNRPFLLTFFLHLLTTDRRRRRISSPSTLTPNSAKSLLLTLSSM